MSVSRTYAIGIARESGESVGMIAGLTPDLTKMLHFEPEEEHVASGDVLLYRFLGGAKHAEALFRWDPDEERWQGTGAALLPSEEAIIQERPVEPDPLIADANQVIAAWKRLSHAGSPALNKLIRQTVTVLEELKQRAESTADNEPGYPTL